MINKRFERIKKIREWAGYSEEKECENDQCLNCTIFTFFSGGVDKTNLNEEGRSMGVYYDIIEDEYICGYCMNERRNKHRKIPRKEECICGGNMVRKGSSLFCEFEGEKDEC